MSIRNSLFYIRYKNFLKQIDHKEIYKELYQAQQIDLSYIALVIISAHIATLGLIVNSPAVIIGAMIISPLMGPIMAGGLSFAVSDRYLGIKAFKSILIGIILSVLFSATVTFISPLKDNTTEILVRTSPNIMDLFIALFSGLAGAFAVTFKKISGSIVGVAISVALMPPLCVTGIGISTGQANVALGGFFLFLTNLTAIFIAAAVFFLIFGFFIQDGHSYDRKVLYRKYFMSFFILLVLSVPLIYTLEMAVKEKTQVGKIKSVLEKNFNIADQSNLDSWKKNNDRITIKINTMSNIPQEKIDAAEQEIKIIAGEEITLDITQIPVFSLYQHGRQPVSSLLMDAISGKVSPQVKDPDETKDQEDLAPYKTEFQQMIVDYPYVNGYQLQYDQENELKSIVVTIAPDYNVSVEQLNNIVNRMEKAIENVEIEILSENISLQQVYFEDNVYELEAGEKLKLDQLAQFLNSQQRYVLTAAGYADSTGGQYINEYVSRMRAETVTNYLIQNGISPERIVTEHSAETDKEKELEEGRHKQRRVDLKITHSGFGSVEDINFL